MLLVPNSSTCSTTLARKPFSTDATPTMITAPMNTPRMVRNERNRRSHSVAIASLAFSMKVEVRSIPASLRPQRFDGVEPRRLLGRLQPEEHADRAADHERQERCPDRERRRQRREGAQHPRDEIGDGDADRPACAREHHGLDQELELDVALPRADRL